MNRHGKYLTSQKLFYDCLSMTILQLFVLIISASIMVWISLDAVVECHKGNCDEPVPLWKVLTFYFSSCVLVFTVGTLL